MKDKDPKQHSLPSDIVTIHGVGNPEPGELLKEFISLRYGFLLKKPKDAFYAVSLPKTLNANLIEVNWSDIRRPLPTVAGLLSHLFGLLYAMLGLGEKGFDKPLAQDNKHPGQVIPRLYRWFFMTYSIWMILIPLVVLVATTKPDLEAYILASAVIFGVAFLMGFNLPPRWRWPSLIIWNLILIGLGVSAHFFPETTTLVSTHAYQLGQAMTAGLLFLAAINNFFRARAVFGVTKPLQRLSYVSFLYLPFTGLVLLGSLLWGLILNIVLRVGEPNPTRNNNFDNWATWFVESLWYKLGLMETVLTVAMAALGSIIILAGISYFLVDMRGGNSGKNAQDWVGVFLVAAPIILLVCFGVFIVLTLFFKETNLEATELIILYTQGTLRVVPYIGFMVSGLRVVLDVVGDVVFYLTPKDSGLAIREQVRRRFREVIKQAFRLGANNLSIVAHSQGTIVASEEFLTGFGGLNTKHLNKVQLFTLGSPLSSLYERFLGWNPSRANDTLTQSQNWSNIYRKGDYIGGPIDSTNWTTQTLVDNYQIGPGGHTHYWSDPRIQPFVPEV